VATQRRVINFTKWTLNAGVCKSQIQPTHIFVNVEVSWCWVSETVTEEAQCVPESGGPDRVTGTAPPVARQLSVFQHSSSSFNSIPSHQIAWWSRIRKAVGFTISSSEANNQRRQSTTIHNELQIAHRSKGIRSLSNMLLGDTAKLKY
jgi:hypothetical protein